MKVEVVVLGSTASLIVPTVSVDQSPSTKIDVFCCGRKAALNLNVLYKSGRKAALNFNVLYKSGRKAASNFNVLYKLGCKNPLNFNVLFKLGCPV